MCFAKNKKRGPEQLMKFIHKLDTAAALTHKSCTSGSQVWHNNESKRGIWPFFLMNNFIFESNRKSDTFLKIKWFHISILPCLRIGTSDKILLPCYYTLGVIFARKTLDPCKDFHFTHCSQGGWAKYPSASKSIKLVFGCHLILHQCFSAFQTHKYRIYLLQKHSSHYIFHLET